MLSAKGISEQYYIVERSDYLLNESYLKTHWRDYE